MGRTQERAVDSMKFFSNGLEMTESNQYATTRNPVAKLNESKKSKKGFGWSALWSTISASSIWRKSLCHEPASAALEGEAQSRTLRVIYIVLLEGKELAVAREARDHADVPFGPRWPLIHVGGV